MRRSASATYLAQLTSIVLWACGSQHIDGVRKVALTPAPTVIDAGSDDEVIHLPRARLAAGESVRFTFVSHSERHRQVRLALRARVDWPAYGGHNPFLGITVNQKPLVEGLLNKPSEFTTYDGSDASWFGHGFWRLLYSPSFDERFERDPPDSMVTDAEPYAFVWDVTALVHAGQNELELRSAAPLAQRTTVVVEDVVMTAGAPAATIVANPHALPSSTVLPPWRRT